MLSARLLNILLNIKDIDRIYSSLNTTDIDNTILESVNSRESLCLERLYNLEELIKSLRESIESMKN
jgi:hypothetical protein